MFFEWAEVKQKWQGILQDFAFKTGHNKKAPKIAPVINKKREVLTTLGDENSALGFVENFVEVMRPRETDKNQVGNLGKTVVCFVVADLGQQVIQ